MTSTFNGQQIHVRPFATGFGAALERGLKVRCQTTSVKLPIPPVTSVRAAAKPPRVRSFVFACEDRRPSWSPAAPAFGSPRRLNAQSTSRRTRLTPPSDTIKLQDRLQYLLQPPLESWLHTEDLQFPFDPFPYQLEGIAFLYPRVAAILSDEMGLGKTMQAITTMRLLLRSGEIRSVLLICPKPLVSNWRREFELWAPELPVMTVEGTRDRREWQWGLRDVPLKIANYELLLRDRDQIVNDAAHFDLVALDEAQRVKNRSSATSQIVRSISRQRSWALTGTPVENSAEDLLGIFEFVSPGSLSAHMSPSRMGKAARDYILRRTKDKVLEDLPPKLFRDAQLELTDGQRESYQLAESQGILRLTEMGEAASIQHVFELVLRLKQICNFDPATGESSKLERLRADLEEVAASGQKAIVFSQWVASLKWLAKGLSQFHPLQYHGGVAARHRDATLERFREDRRSTVLLMSYGAGSVGLNLQFAGYVFLFDRWWNPAVEDQAINRAHRIGARGPVTVSRFLTLGTIEERIDQVLEQKRELFDTILAHAREPRGSGLSQQEIFGLFNLKLPRENVAA